jgi:hypothetical protein
MQINNKTKLATSDINRDKKDVEKYEGPKLNALITWSANRNGLESSRKYLISQLVSRSRTIKI